MDECHQSEGYGNCYCWRFIFFSSRIQHFHTYDASNLTSDQGPLNLTILDKQMFISRLTQPDTGGGKHLGNVSQLIMISRINDIFATFQSLGYLPQGIAFSFG